MQISEKYVIISELGDQKKRKFGRVFKAQNKTSGELCLLKAISKAQNTEHIYERLKNESTFNFTHPSLPKVIETFETTEEFFIVLAFKEGITLQHYWDKTPKKRRLETLKELINQLVPLFQELQFENVVHCDIKPSNILIDVSDSTFKVHLIDFGMAIRKSEVMNSKILFPLGFAAPELILNKRDCIDHTTDIYALGITIWRLFTGKLPLTHPNPSIFTNLQLVHPLPEHSDLPKAIYSILQKMTMKHAFANSPNNLPDELVIKGLKEACSLRYQSLQEVLIDLEKIPEKRSWISKVLYGSQDRN